MICENFSDPKQSTFICFLFPKRKHSQLPETFVVLLSHDAQIDSSKNRYALVQLCSCAVSAWNNDIFTYQQWSQEAPMVKTRWLFINNPFGKFNRNLHPPPFLQDDCRYSKILISNWFHSIYNENDVILKSISRTVSSIISKSTEYVHG